MSYARPVVYQDEARRELQRFLDPLFARSELRTVLDAGCGFVLPVDIPRSARLVGLDVSPEALEKNENIDEAIVGDLAAIELPREEFDAVLCWTVLEHVANPRAAMGNLARSLRPGGVLIVGVPNVWSLKGLVTKLTPHAFHVWVYRRILGMADAGKPGFGPYKTYLHRTIAPRALVRLADAEGLERIYAMTYRPDAPLPRAAEVPLSVVGTLGRTLTLGRWDPEASEHIAVFRKVAPGEGSSSRLQVTARPV